MTHDITADQLWWPNGSEGREIRCLTCDRVLWQSPMYGPWDSSHEFAKSVADGHRAQMKNAEPEKAGTEPPENPVRPRIKSSPQAFDVDLGVAGSTGPVVVPENTDDE